MHLHRPDLSSFLIIERRIEKVVHGRVRRAS